MKKEIKRMEKELKFKVENLEKLEEKLKQMGVKTAGKKFEKNTLFDFEDHSLKNQDKLLRIRTINGEEKGKITFKGPQVGSLFKEREEEETKIEDAKAMQKILAGLGYAAEFIYEKQRTSYKINEATELKVELDLLPILGSFVEIEGKNEEEMVKLANELGLQMEDAINQSYPQLAEEYFTAQGMERQNLIF